MRCEIPETLDVAELNAALSKFDITVPARTYSRTTEHTENWAICRLLSTLGNMGVLRFPISLEHRDRPDFRLLAAGAEVGIEITEAIPEQFAAYCALAEREFPDALLELSHFRWGAPILSLDEMRGLLRQNRLTGAPWYGDSAEREWALFVHGAIGSKLAKLGKSGFTTFPRNWLAIYDNLPMPHINLHKALAQLQPLLVGCWTMQPNFDAIFVESGEALVEITTNGCRSMDILDLWP